jgi:hypothetical protein
LSWRRFLSSIGSYVELAPGDPEALLRLRFYSVFVILAIPLMIGFGIADAINGRYLLAGLIFSSFFGLITGWLRLRAGHDDRIVYRTNALLFGVLVLYMIFVGGDGGSKSLWMFVYPLIIVFLFGPLEGAFWSGALLALAGVILWLPVGSFKVYPYPMPFKLRLASMYLVLMVVVMGFEHSRRRYRNAMLREHEGLERETRLLNREIQERAKAEAEKEQLICELKETLAQVKTLKGLVPICSHCHRIRDDQGFWNQLEAYLRNHSGAQFSHGICPACMERHYSNPCED